MVLRFTNKEMMTGSCSLNFLPLSWNNTVLRIMQMTVDISNVIIFINDCVYTSWSLQTSFSILHPVHGKQLLISTFVVETTVPHSDVSHVNDTMFTHTLWYIVVWIFPRMPQSTVKTKKSSLQTLN